MLGIRTRHSKAFSGAWEMCTEESHTKALEVNDGYHIGCSFYEEGGSAAL